MKVLCDMRTPEYRKMEEEAHDLSGGHLFRDPELAHAARLARLLNANMASQAFASLANYPSPVADGSALSASTSLTDISPTTNGVQWSMPTPLVPGQAFWVKATGRFSTTATPTLLVGLYYGGAAGTSVCNTGTITTASSVTNLTWMLDAIVTVRTAGTSGTIFGSGVVLNIAAAGAINAMAPASAPAAATVDTTTAHTLTVAAQWGTNNASNTITCHQFHVLQLD